MRLRLIFAAVICSLGIVSALNAQETDDADEARRAAWRQVLDGVADDYQLAREPENDRLKLVARPTYIWARSGAHGGNYGSVYVWTHRGNAAAVACFWRNPETSGRASVVHELHSLSPAILTSSGADSDSWQPKAGLTRQVLPDAPKPAATAAGRMQQMRSLCRDFAARSVSASDERTELRLLPQPLYRFESTDPNVVDGALFAFVCSVGTDPEAFLLLEAAKTDGEPRWQYALARFSHMNLFVDFKEKQVWQALRDEQNTLSHNADHTYWVFPTPFEEKADVKAE